MKASPLKFHEDKKNVLRRGWYKVGLLVVYVLKNSHIKYVIQGTLKCISDKKDLWYLSFNAMKPFYML